MMETATSPITETLEHRLRREHRERRERLFPKPSSIRPAVIDVKPEEVMAAKLAPLAPYGETVTIMTKLVFEATKKTVLASQPTVRLILRECSREYRVGVNDIRSARRTADIVLPRQVAAYLLKTLTLRSFPDIGRRLGGRDHTTILHAYRKIETLIRHDQKLAERVEAIAARVLATCADAATIEIEQQPSVPA